MGTGKKRMTFYRLFFLNSRKFWPDGFIISFIMLRLCLVILFFSGLFMSSAQNRVFFITHESPVLIRPEFFNPVPAGGDTIFISGDRAQPVIFEDFNGKQDSPLVIINQGKQVNIVSANYWSALEFKNCRYLKVSGKGSPDYKYGFKLKAQNCGVAFTGLSSDCELENVQISHDGFFGIMAKEDYHGFPPDPVPVFEKLVIHDCLVENVTEGMYLGETISPGMEFKHVRIFNNIVNNTGREGIQIANMTEDVEIYNNLILNSGIDQSVSQGNNFQIGDNSKGRIYNNIFLNASESGVIVLGSGEIQINNNYLGNNQGIFIDNRKITIVDGEIIIRNNHFYQNTGNACIKNLNELNTIILKDNTWTGNSDFFSDKSGNRNIQEWNNLIKIITPITIASPESGNFSVNSAVQDSFFLLGPQEGLSFQFNYEPVLDPPDDIFLDWNRDTAIVVRAAVADDDTLDFSFEDLPDFVAWEEIGNGKIRLKINPDKSDSGKYVIKVAVSDRSHRAKDRDRINLAVSNPLNRPPVLSMPETLIIETLINRKILVAYSDPDGDTVMIAAENMPSFAELVKESRDYYLQLSPRYIDKGIFSPVRIIADDGFGMADTASIRIDVIPVKLISGMPLFRINCGGPPIKDAILNWEGDYSQILPYEVTDNHHTGSHTWKGINNTGAPDNLFGPWCYDPEGGTEMKWEFPCENGIYSVNLFFSEIENDIKSTGPSVFDVYIQGKIQADDLNIFAEAGLNALKKTFRAEVKNNKIEIEFIHVQNNPKINGIEIIYFSGEDSIYSGSDGIIFNTLYPGKNFHVFPNPAADYFYIGLQGSSVTEKLKIELVNLFGEVVTNGIVSYGREGNIRILLDRSEIRSGIYFVRISRRSGPVGITPIIIN